MSGSPASITSSVPEGTWRGGREKAPAALCRKVAEGEDRGQIEIWGDGEQTRSFLYIDECLDGVRRLVDSDFTGPVNIGSEEMVTINQLAGTIADIAGKRLRVVHIPGPLGVRGRNSDNRLIRERLQWAPSRSLREGLREDLRLDREPGARGQPGRRCMKSYNAMARTRDLLVVSVLLLLSRPYCCCARWPCAAPLPDPSSTGNAGWDGTPVHSPC